MAGKEIIKISGMSCAACAARVEKGLQGLAGVRQATVNLALEQATVEYDDQVVNREKFVETIKNLGYGVDRRSNHRGAGKSPAQPGGDELRCLCGPD